MLGRLLLLLAVQLQYLVCWCNDGYDAKWKELELKLT